jgi:hypothetical protein
VPFRIVLFLINHHFFVNFDKLFTNFFSQIAFHFCIYWFFQNGVLQSLDLHLYKFYGFISKVKNLAQLRNSFILNCTPKCGANK